MEELELFCVASMIQTDPITLEKYLTTATKAKHLLILHMVISLNLSWFSMSRTHFPLSVEYLSLCSVWFKATSSRVRMLAVTFQLYLPGSVTLDELLNCMSLVWTKWLACLHVIYYFHQQPGEGINSTYPPHRAVVLGGLRDIIHIGTMPGN